MEEVVKMIAIKGFEMPTKCSQCGFCINQKTNDYGSFGECSLQNRKTVNCLIWSRDSDCPLTEIITCKNCNNHAEGALDEEICLKGHELIHENFYCADAESEEE